MFGLKLLSRVLKGTFEHIMSVLYQFKFVPSESHFAALKGNIKLKQIALQSLSIQFWTNEGHEHLNLDF